MGKRGYQVAEEGVSSRRGGGIKSQKKFFVRSTSGLFGGKNSQNNQNNQYIQYTRKKTWEFFACAIIKPNIEKPPPHKKLTKTRTSLFEV